MNASFFNFESSYGNAYEGLIRRVFPGYDHMYQTASAMLVQSLPPKARLMIVGAGGGKEIATFGPLRSGWTFTGVDPSEQMIQLAKQKLQHSAMRERVELHTGYVHELPHMAAFDGATCMLVLHFVSGDEAKRQLLQGIAERLKDRGALLIVSITGQVNSDSFLIFRRALKAKLIWNGMNEHEAESIIDKAEQEMSLIPSERVEQLLDEAGFEHCHFFRELHFDGWIAFKRGG